MSGRPAPDVKAPLTRFYKEASISTEGAPAGEALVRLDGRPVKTPARRALSAPPPVAARIAQEWNAQGDFILPLSMPMTRLVNAAIDGVAQSPERVADDILAFADNDLVFYRAEAPEGLVARQRALWDPVVRTAEERTGVRLVLAEGVMPVRQDERFAQRLRPLLPGEPLSLAALHLLATLTGSVLVSLQVADRALAFDEAWSAAHVDEDWNIAEWGEDAQAAARRAVRRRDAEAAAFVLTAPR